MSENKKYAMSLNYGPREDLLLKELDQLGDEKKIPKNKNEILRRGLYAYRYLSEVNESHHLFFLSKILKSLSKEFDRTILQLAEDISFSILSIMTVKYGLSKADTFQTIPMNLRMFNQISEEVVEKNQVEEEIKQNIGKLADSIETVFLSPIEMTMYDTEGVNKLIEFLKGNFLDGIKDEKNNNYNSIKENLRIRSSGGVRIAGVGTNIYSGSIKVHKTNSSQIKTKKPKNKQQNTKVVD